MVPKNIEEQVKDLNEEWKALLIGISLAKVPDPLKMQLYSDVALIVEAAVEAMEACLTEMLKGKYVLRHCDICEGATLHISQGTDTDDEGRVFEIAICTVCQFMNAFDVKEKSEEEAKDG